MTKTSHVPEGWHTVTPRIVAHDARHLVEFLRRVFDATGDDREQAPAGDSPVSADYSHSHSLTMRI